MGGATRVSRWRIALLALLFSAAFAGCGVSGGSGGTEGTAAGGGGNGAGPGTPASGFHPKHHEDSGGGSAQFKVKGGDNSVQEFGSEASEAELQAAATALHGFLDARAERNWAAACGYLAKSARDSLSPAVARAESAESCAAVMAALSGNVPTATLREAANANVGALRTEGDHAFLIYRAPPEGTIYAMPMSRQGDNWKVAALSGLSLN
jgi:hypothetical protein